MNSDIMGESVSVSFDATLQMILRVVDQNVDEEKSSVLECFTIQPQQLLQNSWPIKVGLIRPL